MSKRFEELDILRGLSIIAVIIIHITSTAIVNAQGNFEESIAIIINQVTRFAVPAFIILSGWGLTISKKYNLTYLLFLKTQLSKILVFYVIWNLIYYVLTIDEFSFISLIKGLVFGTSYYHLYYVPVIIFFYLIYPLLYKITNNKLFIFVILIITIVSQLADFITGIEIFNLSINIFNWIFYFVFGIWLADNFSNKVSKIKYHKGLIIFFTVVIFAGVVVESIITYDSLGQTLATTSMRPSVIFMSIVFTLFVITVNWSNVLIKKLLIKLANASYGIYLSHALILTVYDISLTKFGVSLGSPIYILSALIIVPPISYVVSILMDKVEAFAKNCFKKTKIVLE